MQNLHRPVSNRGQWRDSLTIYADGLPDPSLTVYSFTAWPRDAYSGLSDYGWRSAGSCAAVLATRSDDNTGRLAVRVLGNSIAIDWLFPASQMFNLGAGSYEGSISAIIGDEMSEIEPFGFVVQARGSSDRWLPVAPIAVPLPPLPPPGAVLTPEAVAALLPTLPTTLPPVPGRPWNNGGFLSWS